MIRDKALRDRRWFCTRGNGRLFNASPWFELMVGRVERVREDEHFPMKRLSNSCPPYLLSIWGRSGRGRGRSDHKGRQDESFTFTHSQETLAKVQKDGDPS